MEIREMKESMGSLLMVVSTINVDNVHWKLNILLFYATINHVQVRLPMEVVDVLLSSSKDSSYITNSFAFIKMIIVV